MILQEDSIQTEYHTWKKNAPYLYNILYTQNLEWPSLSVQWLPNTCQFKDEGYTIHNIIYGTDTESTQTNFIKIARVKIPNNNQDKQNVQQNKQSTIGITEQLKQPKIQVIGQIVHDGQVNRIRYNPFQSDLIATKTVSGQVHIFKYTGRLKQTKDTKFNPQYRLKGHTKPGYALNWNEKKANILLSSGQQKNILMFDITKLESQMDSVNSFEFHKSTVGDISYHKFHGQIFASADDDGIIAIWDSRNKSKKVIHNFQAHDGQIYSIDFSRKNQYLLCSGANDKIVKVWDLRNLENSLFNLQKHKGEITKVQWSPTNKQVLFSSCTERRLNIWDLSKEEQLRYVHAGHKGSINQFDVNSKQVDAICSVDSNNDINVFVPNPSYMTK